MPHDTLLDFIATRNHSGTEQSRFLKEITDQYPFFSPAQFYLLQQIGETDTSYTAQAAKTALLFNNPHWLQFRLQPHDTIVVPFKHDAVSDSPEPVETHEYAGNDKSNLPVEETPKEEELHTEVESLPEAVVEPAATPTLSLTQEALMLAEDPDATDDAEREDETTPVKITIPGLKEVPVNENLPAFEPMHMVDYFASQGIKLTDEVQTADKLGKQLKSFTEWLKTMKKIHIPDNEANAGVSDIAIQALAAKSNKEGEIVTEAMAEVLIQQGKAGKAVEVYKKLSLLNPSKSAFFAAKIEQLKGS